MSKKEDGCEAVRRGSVIIKFPLSIFFLKITLSIIIFILFLLMIFFMCLFVDLYLNYIYIYIYMYVYNVKPHLKKKNKIFPILLMSIKAPKPIITQQNFLLH